MVAVSAFPPSFDGNPWSYGFALFSLTLVSALSLGQLMAFWLDERRRAQLSGASLTWWTLPIAERWTLLTVHRSILAGLHLTVLFGALPDVIVMLAWGESTAGTMRALFMIDRVFDAATIWPYVASSALGAWASQALPQRLVIESPVQMQAPRWWMIRDKLRIGAVVLTIATGVTLGKAGVAL